jgi:methionyl-tRNA synthetase
MSGPYLKVDVLSRHLETLGGEAYVVCGDDVFESHIELKAIQLGVTERDVCMRYSRLIQAELAALSIRCRYTNPLLDETNTEYVATNIRTIEDLVRQSSTEVVRERVGFSPSTGRYVAGCWASGKCPICSAPSGSYLCEACGAHFKPEDLRDVRPRFDALDVEPRTVSSLFLAIRKRAQLEAHLERMGVSAGFRAIAARYFDSQGPRVRLTNPSRWGIPCRGQDSVVFTYTALFSFSLFCAAELRRAQGLSVDPFALESEFVTVASFGIDNAVPYLVGVIGSAIELGRVRPFDHYLTNHFYHLEGKKFSTSRVHLVYARDLVAKAGVSADSLRYFLSRVNPELRTENFVVDDFVKMNDTYLAGVVDPALSAAWDSMGEEQPPAPSDGLVEHLRRALDNQSERLRLPATNMSAAVASLDSWIELRRSAAANACGAYWWLKGYALLAYPFLPSVAAAIWERLGHDGAPRRMGFFERPALRRVPAPRFFRKVDRGRIDGCVFRDGKTAAASTGVRT